MKRCFLIGHRDAPYEIEARLTEAVMRHICEYGVEEFLVGGYGRFDGIAATVLGKMKEKFPHITLILLCPYHPAQRKTELPKGFTDSVYPFEEEKIPRRFAIQRANRWAVEMSTHLIAYIAHPASSAREIVAYAMRRAEKGLISVENIGTLFISGKM